MPTGDTPTASEWSTIELPTKVWLILETWRYLTYDSSIYLSNTIHSTHHAWQSWWITYRQISCLISHPFIWFHWYPIQSVPTNWILLFTRDQYNVAMTCLDDEKIAVNRISILCTCAWYNIVLCIIICAWRNIHFVDYCRLNSLRPRQTCMRQ